REERGHVISGKIANATIYQSGGQSWGVNVTLLDVRNRADVGTALALSTNNFVFGLYGVPDGEYELYASQGSTSGDSMTSQVNRVKVQGADVTGITLTLGPMASIDGHVIVETTAKASCGKRRESAVVQTLVYARRFEP